jgi:hypothetical protein
MSLRPRPGMQGAAELLRLGQAVCDITGQHAEVMVRAALEDPSATLLAWSALYRSSMIPH